jgi:hypothetical protein
MSAMTVLGTAAPMPGTANVSGLSADIGARAELMEGFRVCAKCGADNFTQRPVPPQRDGPRGPTASEAMSLDADHHR